MEFRLIAWHLRTTEIRDTQYRAWVGYRLIDILTASAMQCGATEESRKACIDNAADSLKVVLDLGEKKEKPREDPTPKATDEQKTAYLGLLGRDKGYSSLAELEKATHALNDTITQVNDAHTAKPDADDRV